MLTLRKSEAQRSRPYMWAAVEKQLEPISYDVDRAGDEVVYRISSFAPFIRFSMFAPFAEARLFREKGCSVLQLKLTRVLLIPFAIALVGLLAFRAIGPVSLEAVAAAIIGPTLLIGLDLARQWRRLRDWWSGI